MQDASIPLPSTIKSSTDVSSPKIGKQESKEHNKPASRIESPLSSPKNILLKSNESEAEANQRPLDAMERAQAALATAEHALAAARAAAELSKVKLFTPESPKHFH